MTDRAISVQVNYTLSLVIVTLLLSGVLLATNDVLRTQRSEVVRSELQVLGNRVASDMSAADQLAGPAGSHERDKLNLTTTVPESLAGVGYEISVRSEAAGDHWLVHVGVESTQLSVNETMQLKTETRVLNRTVLGGPYRITYVDTDGDGEPDALDIEADT